MRRLVRPSSTTAKTSTIPGSDIDRLLLSCCDAPWRKVARIIGKTYETLEARGIAISGSIAKFMDARMAVLVPSGKPEAKGNINRWGYREVGLQGGRQTRSWIVRCDMRQREKQES